ncbi:uncharacterized protein LOC120676668 [Panicum virgatum]|uniref:uncharacterized protein LOC120676668 n=1 Tax=Panicum virgatum TaxID=38727 RepID=UPI0019D514AA|nr:uncharacterized protein LOC120676668 [Panicum virgatum]
MAACVERSMRQSTVRQPPPSSTTAGPLADVTCDQVARGSVEGLRWGANHGLDGSLYIGAGAPASNGGHATGLSGSQSRRQLMPLQPSEIEDHFPKLQQQEACSML